MSRYIWVKVYVIVAALTILMGMVLKAEQFRAWERLYFNIQEMFGFNERCYNFDCIHSFEVVLQGKRIAGEIGLSSLTYNPVSDTLYTVSDDTHEVLELSREGDIVRRITLSGFEEVEAIEYIGDNIYLLAEEPNQRISTVRIDDETEAISYTIASVSVAIELNGNKGFEGLAYDKSTGNIMIAKERDPVRIYSVRGFPDKTGHFTSDLTITSEKQRTQALFLRDVSGLEVNANNGHLYALSHESKLIVELNGEGKAVSSLSLLKGQSGLTESIPQAEGVVFTPDGTLYVMSEPNLLYSFKKK